MTKRTTITIEDELLEKTRVAAAKNRREISAEICQLIEEGFEARKATERRRELQRRRFAK